LFDHVTAPHPAAAFTFGLGVAFCAAFNESVESLLPPHAASKLATIPLPIPAAILVFNSLSSGGHDQPGAIGCAGIFFRQRNGYREHCMHQRVGLPWKKYAQSGEGLA
jgi:hypothetical protein